MNRRSLLTSATALALLLAAPMAQAADPIKMRFGTSTLNDVQHQWMIEFAEILGAKSEGRIAVEVYPASQLGATTRMIEQTQMNAIQGVVVPPEFLGGVDPRFQVLSAPGLFDDLEHTARTLEDPAFNSLMLGLGADKGLKGLGIFISGPAAFVARTPVVKPEDFKGAKVRVLAADLQMAQIRTLGGTPIPMPPSEVLPALQQGTLDAVMSCIPVFEGLGYMDGAKYFIETNHGVISTMAIISQEWFEELPADLQTQVTEAGAEATAKVRQFSFDDIADAKQQWVAKGGEIIALSDEQRKAFMDVLLPVGPAVIQAGTPLAGAYDLLSAAIERTRTAN